MQVGRHRSSSARHMPLVVRCDPAAWRVPVGHPQPQIVGMDSVMAWGGSVLELYASGNAAPPISAAPAWLWLWSNAQVTGTVCRFLIRHAVGHCQRARSIAA